MNHSFPWLFPDSFKIPWLFDIFSKFPDFSLTGKSCLIFPGIPGFPVSVGTLAVVSLAYYPCLFWRSGIWSTLNSTRQIKFTQSWKSQCLGHYFTGFFRVHKKKWSNIPPPKKKSFFSWRLWNSRQSNCHCKRSHDNSELITLYWSFFRPRT